MNEIIENITNIINMSKKHKLFDQKMLLIELFQQYKRLGLLTNYAITTNDHKKFVIQIQLHNNGIWEHVVV